MPRRIKGPDGTIHSFPDNATDQQISAALKAIPEVNKPSPAAKIPTWSDALGLNTPSDSMMGGFVKGAASGAVDLVQGATSNVVNRVNRNVQERSGEKERLLSGHATIDAAVPESEPVPYAMAAPETFSGKVGEALPTVAEIAIPGGVGTRAAINAIPRVARAGEKFQEVMGAAKNIPVDVKEVGDVSLRIYQLAERGGALPMAVRKLLNRMTDPNKAPMLYEESRDFASNISRLSADDFGRLTPAVAREVANLRVAINQANLRAAQAAGKGAEYSAAMKEYAQAMRIRNVVNAAIDGAKKSAPYATAAGLGGWLGQKFASLIDQ